MKKNLDVTVANPAGNITILVKTRCQRSEYQKIASQLLAMEELGGEQVAFIQDVNDDNGTDGTAGAAFDGRVEMCGLEFCGNASRTFGLMLAREKSLKGDANVRVSVSGCDEVLDVAVNTDTGHTKIKMPMHKSCIHVNLSFLDEHLGDADLIDMDGIIHVVLRGVEANEKLFEIIKEYVMKKFNPPAMGVMFMDEDAEEMVPVVYVKDVDTTYFEGSCGSGTTACGIALAQGAAAGKGMYGGTYSWNLKQPAGEIMATVEMKEDAVTAVYIEGPVEVDEPMTVEVEI